MSFVTYKLKHNRDFSSDLIKAKKIAEYAILNRKATSKNVKHFGLSSYISCQIIRKYAMNLKTKKVSSVKLIVPKKPIKFQNNIVYISFLNLSFDMKDYPNIISVRQVELGKKYAYICCELADEQKYETEKYIGIDRNATGHIAVCAINSKIIKLGKKAYHVHNKYKNIRKKFQKQKKYNLLKKIRNRESRITRDLNHNISRKIVNLANQKQYGIKLEKLKGITKNKKSQGKNLNNIRSNWSFYQLEQFIIYKAKLLGVPVAFIDPSFTSQNCSRCGLKGERDKKSFKCLNENCKHVDHADSNAAFNIAKGSII